MTFQVASIERDALAHLGKGAKRLELAAKRQLRAIQKEETAKLDRAVRSGQLPETNNQEFLSLLEPFEAGKVNGWSLDSWNPGFDRTPRWLDSRLSELWKDCQGVPEVFIDRDRVGALVEPLQASAQAAQDQAVSVMSEHGLDRAAVEAWLSRTKETDLWPLPGREPTDLNINPKDEVEYAIGCACFLNAFLLAARGAAARQVETHCALGDGVALFHLFDYRGLRQLVDSRSVEQVKPRVEAIEQKFFDALLALEVRTAASSPPEDVLLSTLPDEKVLFLDDEETALGEYLIRACRWQPLRASSPGYRYVLLTGRDLKDAHSEMERIAKRQLDPRIVARVGDEFGPDAEHVEVVLKEFALTSGHRNAANMRKLLDIVRGAAGPEKALFVYWEA